MWRGSGGRSEFRRRIGRRDQMKIKIKIIEKSEEEFRVEE